MGVCNKRTYVPAFCLPGLLRRQEKRYVTEAINASENPVHCHGIGKIPVIVLKIFPYFILRFV